METSRHIAGARGRSFSPLGRNSSFSTLPGGLRPPGPTRKRASGALAGLSRRHHRFQCAK
eukprot:2177920-Alexandrium_andersonii.AAC.1